MKPGRVGGCVEAEQLPNLDMGGFCGARDLFVCDVIKLVDLLPVPAHNSDDQEGVHVHKVFVESGLVSQCEDCPKAVGFVLEIIINYGMCTCYGPNHDKVDKILWKSLGMCFARGRGSRNVGLVRPWKVAVSLVWMY